MDDLSPLLKLTVEEKEPNHYIRFCPPYQFTNQSIGPLSISDIALCIHGVASLGERGNGMRNTAPCNKDDTYGLPMNAI